MHRVGAPKALHNGNLRNSKIMKTAAKEYQHSYCRPNSDSVLSPIKVEKNHKRMIPPLSTNARACQTWVIIFYRDKFALSKL